MAYDSSISIVLTGSWTVELIDERLVLASGVSTLYEYSALAGDPDLDHSLEL